MVPPPASQPQTWVLPPTNQAVFSSSLFSPHLLVSLKAHQWVLAILTGVLRPEKVANLPPVPQVRCHMETICAHFGPPCLTMNITRSKAMLY